MSELPGRPDLDQLRRQARELLRAATEGEPHALTRLRAVSERVTLSAAQLALAREYGFAGWPALRAEAERRRRWSEPAARPPSRDVDERAYRDPLDDRWSFGGAAALATAAGVLSPRVLVAGPGQAVLDAALMPAGQTQPGLAAPPRPGGRNTREMRIQFVNAAVANLTAQVQAAIDEVIVTDDRAARYTLTAAGTAGGEPVGLRLRLDPVPARDCGWIELRSQDGSAARLLPAARPAVRVRQPAPAPGSPAERELAEHALSLIEIQLTGTGRAAADQDQLRWRCSAALARAAAIRQSGGLDPASELPDQLARLCASLTGQHQAGGLPPGWSAMVNAAHRTDGPRQHLDLAAALPPIDRTVVQVDSLVSEPGSWHIYLRARPGWWAYSEDRDSKWAALSVQAGDNLGGRYLSTFAGSTPHGDHEELVLQFLPRLDPLARVLTLTFRGADQQVVLDLRLAPAAKAA